MPFAPCGPLKSIWNSGLSFWYDVGSDQFASRWGEGSREVHFLIVRSLGVGTEDPLGKLSLCEGPVIGNLSPHYKTEKINWPVHWLAASRLDELSEGTHQLRLSHSTFSYTKRYPFILFIVISLYSPLRKIKAKLSFVKGKDKTVYV